MEDLEQRIKQLEIDEKKLKNKSFWFTIFTPILTIVISLITTLITINSDFRIDKQNYTQEQINNILEDTDLIKSREKLQFLLEANLVGDSDSKEKIMQALNHYVTNDNIGSSYFLSGVTNFYRAYDFKNKDSVRVYYLKSISDLTKSLEFEPENYEARIKLGLCYNNISAEFSIDRYYEKAIIEYDIVLEENPNNNYVIMRKLNSLNKLNRKEKICELIKKVNVDDLYQNDIRLYNDLKLKHKCN